MTGVLLPRSFDQCLHNTGASSQRSRPVPRPVVVDVLAFLSWCCRPSRGCSRFLVGGYRFSPGCSTAPQFQVHLSGFCPGQEVLALARPVVPSTLALSSKRSRSVVSPASCRAVASQASYRRVALRLSLLCSPPQAEVIPKNPKNTKHDCLQSMPS